MEQLAHARCVNACCSCAYVRNESRVIRSCVASGRFCQQRAFVFVSARVHFSVVISSPRSRLTICLVAAPQCQDSTRILSAARPCSHGLHHAEESLHHCCWREARRKTQWHPRRQRQRSEESEEGSSCCKPCPLVAKLLSYHRLVQYDMRTCWVRFARY